MNKLTLKTGDRELLLRYDIQAMCEIEEEYGCIEDLLDKMAGNARPADAALFLISCTANAGERHRGGRADITPEWLKENLSPKQLKEGRVYAQLAVMLSMKREYATDDDGDVDEVLEEIRKKKEMSSPAESPRADT